MEASFLVNGNGHTFNGNGPFYWVIPPTYRSLPRADEGLGRPRYQRWRNETRSYDEVRTLKEVGMQEDLTVGLRSLQDQDIRYFHCKLRGWDTIRAFLTILVPRTSRS